VKKPKLRLRYKKRRQDESPLRITNETVAQHRERILAGGRKFKYPRQYVRHKLVINAILISFGALIILIIVGWLALYKEQNTSQFMYKVTQVLPLPVAYVDGHAVRYGDYLMQYRGQEYELATTNQTLPDQKSEQAQLAYIKRMTLDNVIAETYAMAVAPKYGVTVDDKDVTNNIDAIRHMSNGVISQQSYDASVKNTLNFSPVENHRFIKLALYRQRVAFAMDTSAKKASGVVQDMIKADRSIQFQTIVDNLKKQGVNVQYGVSGYVSKDNQDGGLAKAATNLQNGQISGVIMSTRGDDGYCFVQKIGSNDAQVNYQYISLPLTAFDKAIQTLQHDRKIQKLISTN
jgi:hypothetical protein